MVKQSVHQCAVRISGRRVDNHPFGLVNDQKMFIFIHNVQRNRLGDGFNGLGVWQRQLYRVAGCYFIFFVDRNAVTQHHPLFHQCL